MNRNPLGQENSLRPHHFLSGTMPLLPCQVAPASPHHSPISPRVFLISPVPPPILLSLRARHSQAPISGPYIAKLSGPSEAALSNAFLNSTIPSRANSPNTQMPPIATAFLVDLHPNPLPQMLRCPAAPPAGYPSTRDESEDCSTPVVTSAATRVSSCRRTAPSATTPPSRIPSTARCMGPCKAQCMGRCRFFPGPPLPLTQAASTVPTCLQHLPR